MKSLELRFRSGGTRLRKLSTASYDEAGKGFLPSTGGVWRLGTELLCTLGPRFGRNFFQNLGPCMNLS